MTVIINDDNLSDEEIEYLIREADTLFSDIDDAVKEGILNILEKDIREENDEK